MEHGRYIVVEGAIGAGKAALAEKIAKSFGARAVLERSEDNPFLALYLKERDIWSVSWRYTLDRVSPTL